MKHEPMWSYWRDKKGVRAAVDQYKGAMNVPRIAAAVFALDRAEAALDAIMSDYDELVGDQ